MANEGENIREKGEMPRNKEETEKAQEGQGQLQS